MIVIADTTPIISLLKIDKISLLKKIFETVKIPKAVYNEITSNSLYYEEVEKFKNCDFFEVIDVDDSSVGILRKATGLDLGESEALVLSDKLSAEIILMDEVKGRKVAKTMGIKVMGTIGILALAFEKELIKRDEILICISILKNSRRFIGNDIFNHLLEIIK